jgi:shikimate kinase
VARLAKESTGRPLLNTGTPLRHRIETLMAQRTSTYEATAHHIIDTDGISVDELAHSIISVINR